jgi:hypothetical protein
MAKCLWAEIYSLNDQERGGCYASDEYLLEFMGIKRSRLHEILKDLKDHNLLHVVSFNGREVVRKAICPWEKETEKQLSGKPDSSCAPERKTAVRKTGQLRSGKPDSSPYIDRKEEKETIQRKGNGEAPPPEPPGLFSSFAKKHFETLKS